MLRKHEWTYLKQNTERPQRVDVGDAVYQIWTNVWPRKEGVTISIIQFGAASFLHRPTDATMLHDEDEKKISYEWFNGAV